MRRPFLNAGCWIFDLDGTLTQPVHDFEYIRRQLGFAPGADILATIARQSDDVRPDLQHRLDELELFYACKAKASDGALSLLQKLAENGCRLGILTRNKKEIAISSLQAIGAAEFFTDNTIIGRDQAAAKPDPQGINILLDRWQARADDAVMLGDFRYDLEVGRAAGVATIHVETRPGLEWPELTDLKVSSLDQLLQLIV